MSQLSQQQTPMSSKLTSMLILLREDPPDETTTVTAENEEIAATQDDLVEGDNEDIILGGDVCNCRKSKCLKLYCQCFNAARVCNEMCRCVNCSNTDSNENGRSEAVKIILDRNPAAFDSKFLSRDLQAQQRAHKSGCKCRKSMCLKKYCECFEASLPCSSTCICIECHNTSSDASLLAIRRGELKEPATTDVSHAKPSRSTRVSGKAKGRRLSRDETDRKIASPAEMIPALPAYTSCASAATADEDPTVVIIGAETGAETAISSSSKKRPSVVDSSDPVVSLILGTASEATLKKGNERTAKQQPSLSKKRRVSPPPTSSSHPGGTGVGDPGLDGSGLHIVRPTMLSRVVATKKRGKDTPRSDQIGDIVGDALLPADDSADCEAQDEGKEVPSVSAPPAKVVGIDEEPVPFLSPGGVTAPATSNSGRAGSSTAEFRRFTSPNTASVASALSLLSRLPVYQKNN